MRGVQAAAPETVATAEAEGPAAVFASPGRLRKRSEFLAAARARHRATPGFVLQARARGEDGPIRVGFTCSKKVGNAVARNRAKRRLREIARLELPAHGRAGWDYVLIGRKQASAERDFAKLRADLADALDRIHA